MKSTDAGYSDRNKENSGNCVNFAEACHKDLLRKGFAPEQLWVKLCQIPDGRHAVLVVNGQTVLDVGQPMPMLIEELTGYIWE